MRIERIEISGFGTLREVTYDLADKPSIILFYGRNEAGKSTMMQFVRSMLFGFPSRSQLADRYEPEAGGAHGGALLLRDVDGRAIRLERYAAALPSGKRPSSGVPVITLEDGTRGGEELLPLIVGDLTSDLFRQLFAFGLDELQEIRTLQSDEISAYLFSTGLGLSGSAVINAEKRLLAEMEQLFKPRGHKQSMNLLTNELETIDHELRRSRDNVDAYEQLTAQISRLDEALAADEHSLQNAESRLMWIDKCLQARDPWQTLRAAELELAELPTFTSFPEDAIRRYEEETKRLEELEHEHRLLSEQLTQINKRMANLHPNELRLSKLQEIEELHEQSAVIRSTMEEKRTAEEELTRMQAQIDAHIAELDTRWSEQDVIGLPSSLEQRAEISSFRSRLQALERRAAHEAAEHERLQREYKRDAELAEETARRAREAEQQLHTIGTSEWRALAPELRRQKLRHIRSLFGEWRACLLEASLAHRRKQEEQKRFAGIKRLLLTFASMNILLPVALLVLNKADLALASGVLLALMNVALFAVRRSMIATAGRSSTDYTSRIQQLAEEVREQLQAYFPADMEDQAAASREDWQVMRRGAAPNERRFEQSAWSLEHAEALAEQLELSLEQLQSAEDNVRQWSHKLEDANKRAVELAERLKEQEARLAAAEHEQGMAIHQWQAWLQERNLSLRLQPETTAELLTRCEQVKQLIAHRDDLQERIAAYTKRIEAFEAQVHEIATALGESLRPDETAVGMLRRLLEQARQDAELDHERRSQRARYQERHVEWTELSERLRQSQARIQALWEEAGADNEAHFRKRAAQHARSRELQQQIKDSLSRLEWLASAAELDRLKHDLASIGGAELERERTELAETIAVIKRDMAEKRERRGKLLNELEKLKEGDEHASLLQRRQEKLAELNKQAAQYIARSLARELLRRTRELYERERQPKVLQAASRYMQIITGGRYERVLAPFGEQRLLVVRKDGRQLDTSYLSRGTAEQLYLAMRFALVETYSATRTFAQASLPLIMDDIFVNFDEERIARCLDVVGEIGTTRQVLMFTCHDYMRRLVTEQLPDATCIAL